MQHYSNYNNFKGYKLKPIFKDENLNTLKDLKNAIKIFNKYSFPTQCWVMRTLCANHHKKFREYYKLKELPKKAKVQDWVYDFVKDITTEKFFWMSEKELIKRIDKVNERNGILKPFENYITDVSVAKVKSGLSTTTAVNKRLKQGTLVNGLFISHHLESEYPFYKRVLRTESNGNQYYHGDEILDINEIDLETQIKIHSKENLSYTNHLFTIIMSLKATIESLLKGEYDKATCKFKIVVLGQIGRAKKFYESINDIKAVKFLSSLKDRVNEIWNKALTIYENDLKVRHIVLGDN